MSALLKRPKPTQKEIVLKMLEEAGDKGIHSFQFMQIQLPRVAARICELRAEGYEISSEHELLYGSATGVRYRLQGGDARERPTQTSAHASTGRPAGKAQDIEADSLPERQSSQLFPQTPYEHMQDAS